MSGRCPARPRITARSVAWPLPVKASEPSRVALTDATRSVGNDAAKGGGRAHRADRMRGRRPDADLEQLEDADHTALPQNSFPQMGEPTAVTHRSLARKGEADAIGMPGSPAPRRTRGRRSEVQRVLQRAPAPSSRDLRCASDVVPGTRPGMTAAMFEDASRASLHRSDPSRAKPATPARRKRRR